MSTILKNILTFSGLAIETPSSQAHLLNINGVAKTPRLLIPNGDGYTITADSTNVTVTRLTGAPNSVKIYCEMWHSIEDCEPAGGISPSDFPLVASGGGSSGGSLFGTGTANTIAKFSSANSLANSQITDDGTDIEIRTLTGDINIDAHNSMDIAAQLGRLTLGTTGNAGGGVLVGQNVSDLVGFYGTAPIGRQTGVAVSAAALHAALVALGLITA